MRRKKQFADGPRQVPPHRPHVGTELGRRCQALYDAIADLERKIAASLDPTNPIHDATTPGARAVLQLLYEGPTFRHVRAEMAAFVAVIRAKDPKLYDELVNADPNEPPGTTEVPHV